MSQKVSRGFSLFGGGKNVDGSAEKLKPELAPSLKLQTDKDVYMPGDSVVVSIEICSPITDSEKRGAENGCSLLIERLAFEIKGIEKLDTQWFATQKPLPGSKQRRGEHVFLECSTPAIISNHIVSYGDSRKYIVRTELPKVIPPSYRGTTIRYLYHIRSTLFGRWVVLENGLSNRESVRDPVELDARTPLQIWATQKTYGLLSEECESDGIFPSMTIQTDLYWKEKDSDTDWVRANEISDGVEEGYDSSRDEISSVSSYNPIKGNIETAFGSSLSLQSYAARSSIKEGPYLQRERSSISSYMALPQLSVAEVIYDSSGDVMSTHKKSSAVVSPSQQKKHADFFPTDNDTVEPSVLGTIEPVASEGFIRGRSYNIRLDDQVLLRFSPKNSDSTYYFSDMIGGTLTFFHEGARRCLEVSITLETSETIGQRFVHPSRRNSPTITKVQSDHHEVVADLVQTSFLFSIPMDGPMSFSTPHISVKWALRFEFFTTPKNVDWTRYEHPLVIEGRDKGEWVLPITVHAPPPRPPVAQARSERPVSLGPLWVRT